jgi:CAAD domains of cyanobacterial aminoacyl-tRNA synthetase
MKSDIALHEIMRLDEYAQEEAEAEAKAESEANSTLSQSVVKNEESVETSLEDAPAMHESIGSLDIPSVTVINYGELPAMANEPAESNLNDETVKVPEETSGAEPEMKIDEEAATKSVDIATTESAIDPGESLTDPEDLPATEDVMKAVESTTDSAKETVMNTVDSTIDAAQETWDTVRAKAPGLFDELLSAIPAFFQTNRQLLINLGVFFLALVAAKLLFAGLDAIDDLPLVTPLLKTVGLVYVVKFIWNDLVRDQERQKLVEKFNKTKAEVLGDPQ